MRAALTLLVIALVACAHSAPPVRSCPAKAERLVRAATSRLAAEGMLDARPPTEPPFSLFPADWLDEAWKKADSVGSCGP